MTAYDPDNVFAKMLRGEIPSHKVLEDDTVLVAMDLFPQSRGHVLVIPKTPSRNLLDADPATLSGVVPYLHRVANAVQSALSPAGIRLMQFNEAAAGQSVFHLHFHLIPVYEGVPMGRHTQGAAEHGELAELARLIAARL